MFLIVSTFRKEVPALMDQFVKLPKIRPPKRTYRALSRVLRELAEKAEGTITFADVRDTLADRSFAALLFFFAAINLLPLPPGSSAILGLPPLIIAAQMIVGQEKVWLPDFILKRPIDAARFKMMIGRMTPWLRRVERLIRPRYWPFPIKVADRVIGVIAFILSVLLVAPIPLGNWLPALALSLFGLALSERDGILFGVAIVITVVALGVIAALFTSAFVVASHVMHM